MGSIPQPVETPLEEMKYLFTFIFSFLSSGVEAKRGVEFCHSTPNASRIRQKVGNERSVLTLDSLCLPCCVRDTAWSYFFLLNASFKKQFKYVNLCKKAFFILFFCCVSIYNFVVLLKWVNRYRYTFRITVIYFDW